MSDQFNRIKLLQAFIEIWYKCDAKFIKTVWVDERFEGTSIWQGDVDVFSVTGHPKANLCYGWLHEDDAGNSQPVILLNKFPINSPETAVRASIALNASLNSDHHNQPKPPPIALADIQTNAS